MLLIGMSITPYATMSSTTTSEKKYAHFPDLQAARRRARDAEIKAFEAFQATEETRIAAIKAAPLARSSPMRSSGHRPKANLPKKQISHGEQKIIA